MKHVAATDGKPGIIALSRNWNSMLIGFEFERVLGVGLLSALVWRVLPVDFRIQGHCGRV